MNKRQIKKLGVWPGPYAQRRRLHLYYVAQSYACAHKLCQYVPPKWG